MICGGHKRLEVKQCGEPGPVRGQGGRGQDANVWREEGKKKVARSREECCNGRREAEEFEEI